MSRLRHMTLAELEAEKMLVKRNQTKHLRRAADCEQKLIWIDKYIAQRRLEEGPDPFTAIAAVLHTDRDRAKRWAYARAYNAEPWHLKRILEE